MLPTSESGTGAVAMSDGSAGRSVRLSASMGARWQRAALTALVVAAIVGGRPVAGGPTTGGSDLAAAGAAAADAPPATTAAAPAAAAKKPMPSVAFQGSAGLIFYYSGVVQALLNCRAVVPGTTRIAGLSGGSYTAVFTELGYSGREQADLWKGLMSGLGTGGLTVAVEKMIDEKLTEDDVKRVNGRVRVGLGQLNARKKDLHDSASWVVSRFENKYDLIAALSSSSYLPCLSGKEVFTAFRGQPTVDGAFSTGFAELCFGDVSKCLKVGTWVVGPLGNKTCDPNVCSASSLASKCNDGLPRTIIRTRLYRNPVYASTGALEIVRKRCPPEAWEGQAPYPLPEYVPQNSTDPDIHPGKFNPLPAPRYNGNKTLLMCQWRELAFALPSGGQEEAPEMEFNLGQADGESWCTANGY